VFVEHQDRDRSFLYRAVHSAGKFLWRVVSNQEVQFVAVCFVFAVTVAILFFPVAEPIWAG
jgi:hypothetical protein